LPPVPEARAEHPIRKDFIMAGVAKAAQYRRKASHRHFDRATRTVLAIAGAMLSLLGFALAVGGYLSPNGSAFHIFIGFALIVSGALVARRHQAGAWTYMLVFAATVSWSLTNIEDGSTLALRLIGPSLMLVMLAVLMPLLCRWRPRQTIAVFSLLIAATVGLGIFSLPSGPFARETAAATRFVDAQARGVLQ
jgi:glucose dehydrogenase